MPEASSASIRSNSAAMRCRSSGSAGGPGSGLTARSAGAFAGTPFGSPRHGSRPADVVAEYYIPLDMHWNQRGHALLAKVLLEQLHL